MAPVFQLSVRSGPNTGTTYEINKEEMFIGRDTTNDIVISDSQVSRRHARLFLQGSNYVIEDLGSTNGTAVGRQRLVGPYVLRPGEEVTLGENVVLVFESNDPGATVASTSIRPPATTTPPVVQAPPPVQQPPRYTPPPQPVQQPVQQPVAPPPPVSVYNREPVPQTPMYDENYVAEPRKLPGWVIPVAVAVLFAVCLCGAALWVVDYNNYWCDLLPFLFAACQ